ncbi:hypothetical protein F511_28061 [Dorcoceras hygrometricum]|uniref:Uncharacterized protein n=1 Tax=Dorcoceras hygrometricum TaxID=472368 RepID=A0A2Z7APG7_9LAMI|nr:hypothetical protein F511_28061 [Dorcoceras hygrometricum]
MLTSSLLVVASPVDMLTSSLLIPDLALLIPDIYCSSSFFDISSSRLHRFCSRSHFRMRPVLFPPKRSNEQDSLLCTNPKPSSGRLLPSSLKAAAAARLRRKIVSGQFDEENQFVLISSVLLVQADEGVSFLVVDRIGDIYRNLPRRADVIVTTVGARHKCQQELKTEETATAPPRMAAPPLASLCASSSSAA